MKIVARFALVIVLGCTVLFSSDKKIISLDDVIVSANKMEESIKNIPQSITVLSDIELEEKGISSIRALIKEIPNLRSSHVYAENVNFRGINLSLFTHNNPIVIYIDGIPQSSMFGFDASFVNVQRVEILRGPQSTLYGKTSIGGVINIVTKTPSDYIEGFVGSEIGSNSSKRAFFNVSGPLIKEKLYFGVNGDFIEDKGWITNHNANQDNDANRLENYKYNLNLNYKISDNLEAKFNISKYKDNQYGINGGAIDFTKKIYKYKKDDFKDANYEMDTYTKTKSNSQAIRINYKLDDYLLTSITTNKKTDIDFQNDTDRANRALHLGLYDVQDSNAKTFTQEFRISNKDKNNNRWVAGVYYEKENFNNDEYSAEIPGVQHGSPFGGGVNIKMNSVSKARNNTIAAFGQVVLPFLSDFELTLGGRYQRIKKSFNSEFFYLPIGMSGPSAYTLDESKTWNDFLPKIALSYKVNDDFTSYFSIAKGYTPGGYNDFAARGTIKDNSFEPQKSINYEFGIKGTTLNNTLSLAATIFYMDIIDVHVFRYDPLVGAMYASNEGKAHSKGFELEIGYNFAQNWTFNSSLGIINAIYDENSNKNAEGKKIEGTASHSLNMGVSYYNPDGFYSIFNIENRGEIYFDDNNKYKDKPYTIANAKIGYLFDNLDIYAYVKNMTDEEYVLSADQVVSKFITFGEGRFIGIGAKYSF